MKTNTKEWLSKIEKEAYDLGLNFFIAVAEGNENVEVKSNNVQNNSNIKDLQTFWEKNIKKFRKVLFRDLYNYIQKAERDYYGYHFPFNDDKNILFHIYEGRRQVNICKFQQCKFQQEAIYYSLVNFVFEPEEELIKIIKVNEKLVADYDNPMIISWDTPINGNLWKLFIGNPMVSGVIMDAIGGGSK